MDEVSKIIDRWQTDEAMRISHDVLIVQILLREAESQLAAKA